MHRPLLIPDKGGLYAPKGDFYIDPSYPVERAITTHAHTDHARWGHDTYICSQRSEELIYDRAISDPQGQEVISVPFNERTQFGDLTISLHPAGHILGSAQVRVTDGNETWVVTGDFKRAKDPTCIPFEPVECDVLITEVTFGLPVYRWRNSTKIFEDIYDWWQRNRSIGQPSILFGYSLGKAQRLLAGLDALTEDTILVHGALLDYNDIYANYGIAFPETQYATDLPRDRDYSDDLIVAPPSAFQSSWMNRFNNPSTALASGWMQIRGIKRRRGYDNGFVLSDHTDWPGLLETIDEVDPQIVYATHGDTDSFCKYLRDEKDIEACDLETLEEETNG